MCEMTSRTYCLSLVPSQTGLEVNPDLGLLPSQQGERGGLIEKRFPLCTVMSKRDLENVSELRYSDILLLEIEKQHL